MIDGSPARPHSVVVTGAALVVASDLSVAVIAEVIGDDMVCRLDDPWAAGPDPDLLADRPPVTAAFDLLAVGRKLALFAERGVATSAGPRTRR